ncbi:MAG: hypothetical protein WCE54_20445 [Ignavibacteriaceae bacterium]
MKYLILFLVVISLPLFAQDKKENDKTALDIQAKEWMTKISSDPEMRNAMMAMILDETNGNNAEMSGLAKTIMDNPGMNSIITGMMQRNTHSKNMTVPSLDMMRDSTSAKTMKMSGHESYQKKQH